MEIFPSAEMFGQIQAPEADLVLTLYFKNKIIFNKAFGGILNHAYIQVFHAGLCLLLHFQQSFMTSHTILMLTNKNKTRTKHS